ncbi:MAG: IS5/IS1182 family transposase, partial [Dehalococcoidia bacterium]|nr:IS5/IS1182 family transposase [Dehalococcoidia bacterium]
GEARLLRKGKGKEAKLVFMAHALMENRNGMLVEAAKERGFHPRTLGGDKGYDTQDCVAALRQRGVTPHVAQNTTNRSSAIDGRTTRHPGYAVSQRLRKRVEEIFGWMKMVGGFRWTRYHGVDRTGLAGYLVAPAYNLVRMANLLLQREEAAAAQAA